MTKFEDVKNETTEQYFEGNEFSIAAFDKKYKLNEKESYVEAIWRVCQKISSTEKTEELRKYWAERWFDEIYNDWWHPAGSIMQGAGSNRGVSLANCTHNSLGGNDLNKEWDNLESIIKNTAYTVAKCAAYRQGLGVDFSRIRPSGTQVKNSANESTGSIHWMKFIDSIGYYVGQKGRIPAMLFSLSISHPDVEDFIKIKSDYTQIQNANISVQATDNFYEAVKKKGDWNLEFVIPEVKKGDKIYLDDHSITRDCNYDTNMKSWYKVAPRDREKEVTSKTISSAKLLDLIAENMFKNAEPGIQNIDIAKKYSNSDYLYDPDSEYDTRIIGTNACSEQYLSRDSLCVLSSINVEKFSVDEKEREKELEKIGESINRFLDNVNEYELQNKTYATPHQKLAIEQLRRTGAGFTNLAGYLFKCKAEYGSKEGNKIVEKFTQRYNYYLYKSSIALGKEKGSFKAFNKEKYCKSPFIKKMMKEGLVFDAMRNVTCSSIAPTGTLSLMFRGLVLSYGIEPAFGMYFWKRTRISGGYKYYFNVPRIVRDFFKLAGKPIPMDSDTIEDTWDGKLGSKIAEFIESNKKIVGAKFCSATEVDPFDKLDLMIKTGKHIDSSLSVTYMLPENTKIKDVSNFIMKAWEGELKSIAAFPDKQMYGIVSYIPFKDLAFKLKSEGLNIHKQNFSEEELSELNIHSDDIKVDINSAPQRPKELDADIYIITAKGEKYIIAVGKYNETPYEVFGGKANGFGIKKSTTGKLIKHSKGKYGLDIQGMIELEDFSKHFSPEEQTVFRLASTSLRHGVPIEFVVEQMQKSTDDMFSLPSAIARVLKKYIKDGQKVVGQKCPNCGSNELIYMDGCVSCSYCDWSKCS